jgi:predicted metal-dependent HD superfamily phosphohydrolase
MNEVLKARFIQMWDMAGAKTEGRMDIVAWNTLWLVLSHPGRYYHNDRHIEGCLFELDSARGLAENPLALEIGLMYHDSVYNTGRDDNEEMSADFMAGTFAEAGLCREFIEIPKKLILATKQGYIPREQDEKLISDIDISCLGQSPDKFDEDSRNIWKEYSWLGPIKYREGRIAVLEGLLQRNSGHIYSTDFFREKYEKMAASNINRALNVLNGLDEDL